jgi:hypothetical protein
LSTSRRLAFTGKHKCDNCQAIWYAKQLEDVENLMQRLDAGGTVPSGECPKCGALCYPVPALPTGIKRFIAQGELDGEDPNTESLLESCGNLLDHSHSWDILGTVAFESDSGAFYEVTVEACINEISAERAKEIEEENA